MGVKVRSILVLGAVVLAAAMAWGCGGRMVREESPEVVTLTLANNHPDDYCTTRAVEWFADTVKERTDGRVVIEVYNNGRLGDTVSCLEQMQYGGIDIVKADVPTMTNFVPNFNVLQMPFIYQDMDHFWKVHGGEIGMGILRGKAIEEKGMYGLTFYDAGTRCFYNSKRPMESIRDMKGMQIRIQESNLMMAMITALEAKPVVSTYGEVYQALESGVVDGADNSIVNYLEQSFYKVAPYFLEDDHTYSADLLVMSVESRKQIGEDDLRVMDEAALESWEVQKGLWKEAEEETRERLKELDVVITQMPQEDFEYMGQICMPLWYDYDHREEFLDLLDRIVAAGR